MKPQMSPMSRMRAMAYLSTAVVMAEVSRICGVAKSVSSPCAGLGDLLALAKNRPGKQTNRPGEGRRRTTV